MRKLIPAIALLLTFLPVNAEDCGPLVSFGTVPLTQIEGSPELFVPVEIAGKPRLLLLDTGSEHPVLTLEAAKELGLRVVRTDSAFYDVHFRKIAQITETTLKLGSQTSDSAKFWVDLDSATVKYFSDPRVAGILGMDILRQFDLSIDFGARTLTLFGPHHCEGHVTYWSERPVFVSDYRYLKKRGGPEEPAPPMRDILFLFPVVLNGVDTLAMLNSGMPLSEVEQVKAEGKLELTLGTEDTPPVVDPSNGKMFGYEVTPGSRPPRFAKAEGKTAPGKTKRQTTYVHRFNTLTLGPITINNPEMAITPNLKIHRDLAWETGNMMEQQTKSIPELPYARLGMNVLRHLRVYIAVKEKRVYISPSSATTVAARTD